jgi:hypothetical protein
LVSKKKREDVETSSLFSKQKPKTKSKEMKYLFVLLLISSCYSHKIAYKDLNKVMAHYPEMVAVKTRQWFPCGEFVIYDTIEKVRWTTFVDSINPIINRIIDTTIVDSCQEKIRVIRILKTKLIDKPVVTKTIKIIDSACIRENQYLIDNEKKLNALIIKEKDKYSSALKVSIWLLVLLILSLIFNFIKR